MDRNHKLATALAAMAAASAGVLVASCGGGGGGDGGGGGGGSTPSPTGVAATISPTVMIAAAPQFAAILPVCSRSTASAADKLPTGAKVLGQSAIVPIVRAQAVQPIRAFTSTKPADKLGSCGGRMTYPAYSHASGITTATVSYENYCTLNFSSEKLTMNGSIDFVNTATPTPSGPITSKLEANSAAGVTMVTQTATGTQVASQKSSFTGFTYTVGVPGGVATASSPDRLTLNDATLTDNVTSKSYRQTNYAVTSFQTGTGGTQVSITGRGYRSNGDFFDISTTTPITSNSSGATSGGEITVTGGGGTSAVLTLVPGATMQATMKVNGAAVSSMPSCL